MSLNDGIVRLDGGSVQIYGMKRLLKDAEAVGLEVQDLKALTYRLATPIADLARTMAPKDTEKMARAIRPVKSKRKVMVRVGSKRLPYAAPRHWGLDSTSGPKWLSRAEQLLRRQTFDGIGLGIKQLLDQHNW